VLPSKKNSPKVHQQPLKTKLLEHQTRDMFNLAKQDRKRSIRESLLYFL
jgi:hypothetical protein